MRITVTLTDGSEQTLDVKSIRTTIAGAPIDLSENGSPPLLRIYSPGDDEKWRCLILHPGA